MEALKEHITTYLAQHIANNNTFIVEVKVLATGKIEVFLDRLDANITIDECASVSRNLENYLETNGLVGEKYTLEVSSPGMDMPFKVQQQFQKSIGKQVEIVQTDGKKIIGTLLSKTEESLVIEEETTKKKVVQKQELTIALSNIKTIKKHFNFKF